MDRMLVSNYFNNEIRSNLKSKKFFLYIFIVFATIFFSVYFYSQKDSNCWNSIFFMLGNRYIYILFFISNFMILLSIFGDENYFFVVRINKKKNWLKYRLLINLFIASLHTILYFIILLTVSIVFQGYENKWSQYSLSGLDMYTSFFNNLTPYQAILLYFIRFFVVVLSVGTLFILLRVVINRIKESYTIIFLYLLISLVFNLSNIPILSMIDISNNYLSYYINSNSIVKYMIFSNMNLYLLIIGEMYFSYNFIKGVKFNCQQGKVC